MSPLLPLLAAAPVLHFARVEDRIAEGTYFEVREETAAEAVWKTARGSYRAWTFRDRRVVRAERSEEGAVVEVSRYDVSGRAESRVHFEGTEPVEVVVDGGTVDVRGWIEVPVGSTAVWLPPGEGTRRTDAAGATVDAVVAPPADVFDPEFATTLQTLCGCRVHSGATTWVRATPAARFSAELRAGDDRRTAELWAVPIDGGTLLVASSASDWNAHTLVRASMALYDLKGLP